MMEIPLTCLVVVCVVFWHVVEKAPSSSHVPVHIGVPLVAVSTQVTLLKITLWTQENQTMSNRP